jgi:hypothetical protein
MSSQDENKDLNNDKSCSSSSVGPAKMDFGIMPIFNQPRLAPVLRHAKVEEKMKQSKFVNYGKLDAKARKAKNIEDEIQKNREEPIEEDEDYPRTSHLAKRFLNIDPGLDFMEPEKRETVLALYSQDPKVLPSKEVKTLKFSKLDRFANNIEINLAAAGNAQMKALETLEQAVADLGFWHIKNSSEFIRNAHALSNLERLKLRDPSSANAIKNHIEEADLISPQMKSIINS